MHCQKSTGVVDERFHLKKPELVQAIRPNVHRVFVSNKKLFQTFIEECGWLDEFSIFVIFNDIYERPDSFLSRQIDHFTGSYCARPSDSGYKSSVDSNLVKQADCDLESCSCGSFLSLISGNNIRVRFQLLDGCNQLFLTFRNWQVVLLVDYFFSVSRVHCGYQPQHLFYLCVVVR